MFSDNERGSGVFASSYNVGWSFIWFLLVTVEHLGEKKNSNKQKADFLVSLKQNVAYFTQKKKKKKRKGRHDIRSNIISENSRKRGKSHQWECRRFDNLHYRCAMQRTFVSARLVIRCENVDGFTTFTTGVPWEGICVFKIDDKMWEWRRFHNLHYRCAMRGHLCLQDWW